MDRWVFAQKLDFLVLAVAAFVTVNGQNAVYSNAWPQHGPQFNHQHSQYGAYPQQTPNQQHFNGYQQQYLSQQPIGYPTQPSTNYQANLYQPQHNYIANPYPFQQFNYQANPYQMQYNYQANPYQSQYNYQAHPHQPHNYQGNPSNQQFPAMHPSNGYYYPLQQQGNGYQTGNMQNPVGYPPQQGNSMQVADSIRPSNGPSSTSRLSPLEPQPTDTTSVRDIKKHYWAFVKTVHGNQEHLAVVGDDMKQLQEITSQIIEQLEVANSDYKRIAELTLAVDRRLKAVEQKSGDADYRSERLPLVEALWNSLGEERINHESKLPSISQKTGIKLIGLSVEGLKNITQAYPPSPEIQGMMEKMIAEKNTVVSLLERDTWDIDIPPLQEEITRTADRELLLALETNLNALGVGEEKKNNIYKKYWYHLRRLAHGFERALSSEDVAIEDDLFDSYNVISLNLPSPAFMMGI